MEVIFLKTSIDVCHYSQAFFNLVLFWVLLWVSWSIFSLLVLLRVLLTHFPCCLSIRLVFYVYFVPMLSRKIVLFPCHPVVGMSSWILPLLASRIFFVVLECPVLSVLFFPVSISFYSPFFHQYLLVYFLELYCFCFFYLCCLLLFFLTAFFLRLIIFAWCRRFLICVSSRISFWRNFTPVVTGDPHCNPSNIN